VFSSARVGKGIITSEQVQSSPRRESGLGKQIFGDTLAGPALSSDAEDGHSEPESAPFESSEDASLTIALTASTINTAPWAIGPSYPAVYLSTVQEYLPPPPRSKAPLDPYIHDSAKGNDWASEAFENSLDVDTVFERFAARVSHEGEQCVR
jgi:pre-rRNA-processing protein TSR4